jgi:hypothetical protein
LRVTNLLATPCRASLEMPFRFFNFAQLYFNKFLEHFPCGCRVVSRALWAFSPMKTPLNALIGIPGNRVNALDPRPYRHIHFRCFARFGAVDGWEVCGMS